jgi:outer membrane protein OmpA-like peptidoglycan-associated protein
VSTARSPLGVRGAPLAITLAGLLVACATPPKPRELEAFETLRRQPGVPDASKKAPDLVAGADKLGEKAHEEWRSNDLDDSRRDALIAQVKLKTALALLEQDQLKAKIQALSGQEAQAQEELTSVSKDLASENEKLALLQKYVEARKTAESEKQRLAQQMTSAQQKAEAEQQRLGQELVAQQKIAAAQLALRTADTVEASKYAKAEYGASGDMLAKAEADLKQNDYAGAQASAEVAEKNAQKAIEISKPLYEQAEQASESKERNDALARDASAIVGVTVKLERRGDLQRLVVMVPELFQKRQPQVAPGHTGVLDAIAALVKRYPSYPVQIIGHTDNRGKSGELLAVSAARAQAVYSELAARGVEARRMMASGLGGEEPSFDNKSASGRAKNNRVEIVFLYH